MKTLIRLHPYVRELEQQCEKLKKKVSRMEDIIDLFIRQIKSKNETIDYLDKENEELKAHLSGRMP